MVSEVKTSCRGGVECFEPLPLWNLVEIFVFKLEAWNQDGCHAEKHIWFSWSNFLELLWLNYTKEWFENISACTLRQCDQVFLSDSEYLLQFSQENSCKFWGETLPHVGQTEAIAVREMKLYKHEDFVDNTCRTVIKPCGSVQFDVVHQGQ